MGEFANKRSLKILVWIITFAVLGLNIYLLLDMIF